MGKQPTIGQKKSKDAIAKAAMMSNKGTKKKWSKKENKEKLNNNPFILQKEFESLKSYVSK